MQIVTSTTASGITTRTANVPGRCYGAVSFAVGLRDEPVALRGISHLVLHLVEAALEPRLIPGHASIDDDSVTFTASGTAAQVLRYFAALGDAILALGKPTTFELGRAKRKLEFELPDECRFPSVNGLTFRYGLGELGRTGFGSPAVMNIGKKDVARWVATWFTSDNAAIALSKPLTASFDIELPAAPRPFRGAPVSRLAGPTLLASENRGVTASIVVPSAGAQELGTVLHLALEDRLAEQAGLAYSVDFDSAWVSDAETLLSFSANPAFVDTAEAVRALVLAFRDIADDGVTAAALALGVEYAKLEAASDPETVQIHLQNLNEAGLRGFGIASREESVATAVALTPESVAAAVAAALPTLLVAFDSAVDITAVAKALTLPVDDFDLVQPSSEKAWAKAAKAPKGSKTGPTVWVGKDHDETEGVEAIVGADAVLFRDGGVVGAIRYADLVLVGERPDGTVVLVDADGRWDSFRAGEWRRGKAFLAELRGALPAGLVVPFTAV